MLSTETSSTGTFSRKLESKNITLVFFALEDDHINCSALLANDMGVTRTGLILKDSDLVTVTQRMGITFAVDIKRVAVDNILAHIHPRPLVRMFSQTSRCSWNQSNCLKRFQIRWKKGGNSGLPNGRELPLSSAEIRQDSETLDRTEKTIVEGDRLILFCRPDRVADLEKRFKV